MGGEGCQRAVTSGGGDGEDRGVRVADDFEQMDEAELDQRAVPPMGGAISRVGLGRRPFTAPRPFT